MFAADQIIALYVIARPIQYRHSVFFCNGKDSRKIGDFDKAKMNGYMPKAVVKLFYADAIP